LFCLVDNEIPVEATTYILQNNPALYTVVLSRSKKLLHLYDLTIGTLTIV